MRVSWSGKGIRERNLLRILSWSVLRARIYQWRHGGIMQGHTNALVLCVVSCSCHGSRELINPRIRISLKHRLHGANHTPNMSVNFQPL